MNDEQGWMGLEECGCLSLLCTTDERALVDVARDVRSLKRRGGTWELKPIDECRSRPWHCNGHAIVEQERRARAEAKKAVEA